jgi:hypothetical protein
MKKSELMRAVEKFLNDNEIESLRFLPDVAREAALKCFLLDVKCPEVELIRGYITGLYAIGEYRFDPEDAVGGISAT